MFFTAINFLVNITKTIKNDIDKAKISALITNIPVLNNGCQRLQ